MSGTSFIKTWPFAAKKGLTERLAKALGWDGTGGERKILEVLENADGKELVKNEMDLLTTEEKIAEHILFPFTPVIEPYVTMNSFLPKDPMFMRHEAWSNEIDCMLGGTSLEGGLMAMFSDNFHEFFQHSDALPPLRVLDLDSRNPADKRKISEVGRTLQKLYFGENLPSPETRFQYFQVIFMKNSVCCCFLSLTFSMRATCTSGTESTEQFWPGQSPTSKEKLSSTASTLRQV